MGKDIIFALLGVFLPLVGLILVLLFKSVMLPYCCILGLVGLIFLGKAIQLRSRVWRARAIKEG